MEKKKQMFNIRYVTNEDKEFWFSIDHHVSKLGFDRKVYAKQGYVMFDGEGPIGIMHYNLLWDNLPFLNHIYIIDEERGKGYGSLAMEYWEEEMKREGFQMVLVSTQVDEGAQHFYRHLGYQDCGGLVLNDCPLAQPMEMFLSKILEKK